MSFGLVITGLVQWFDRFGWVIVSWFSLICEMVWIFVVPEKLISGFGWALLWTDLVEFVCVWMIWFWLVRLWSVGFWLVRFGSVWLAGQWFGFLQLPLLLLNAQPDFLFIFFHFLHSFSPQISPFSFPIASNPFSIIPWGKNQDIIPLFLLFCAFCCLKFCHFCWGRKWVLGFGFLHLLAGNKLIFVG